VNVGIFIGFWQNESLECRNIVGNIKEVKQQVLTPNLPATLLPKLKSKRKATVCGGSYYITLQIFALFWEAYSYKLIPTPILNARMLLNIR
jgi:hypothetical protein